MEIFTYRPAFRLLDLIINPGQATMIAFLISCFSVAVMIFVVFPIRESAQAYMAKFLGDDTAERQGRLTLNPFSHIDRLGAFIMLIAPFGWSKPVPLNPGRCHKVKGRTAVVLIALAGPLANIILAYIIMVIMKLVLLNVNLEPAVISNLWLAFFLIIQLSVFIAVLNLLPLPHFAGGRILFAFLHPRTVFKIMQYQQLITLVFFLLILWGNSPLRVLLEIMSSSVIYALNFLSGFIR